MQKSQAIHEAYFAHENIQVCSDRSFGIVFTVFFLVYAYAPMLSGESSREWALIPAGLFLILAALCPAILHPLNLLWFRLGLLLSKITTPVVMGLMFYGVITPMGLLMRMLGRDPLALRWDASAASYWIHRTPPGPPPEKMVKPY